MVSEKEGLGYEIAETPLHTATYVAVDGLGSTGKSTIQRLVKDMCTAYLPSANVHEIREPPSWNCPELSDLYQAMKEGRFEPLTSFAGLATYRGILFRGPSLFDGEPILPKTVNEPLPKILGDKQSILLSDRSTFSTFYQLSDIADVWVEKRIQDMKKEAARQGKDITDELEKLESSDNIELVKCELNRLYKVWYGYATIPFPDLLFCLFPDDLEVQKQRLVGRILEEGKMSDIQDDPESQLKYLKASQLLYNGMKHMPGVYRVFSGEFSEADGMRMPLSAGYAIALMTMARFLERSGQSTLINPVDKTEISVTKLSTEYPISSYKFVGLSEQSLPSWHIGGKKPRTGSGSEIGGLENTIFWIEGMREEITSKLHSFGDLGLFFQKNNEGLYNIVVVAIESPDLSIKQAYEIAEQGSYASFDDCLVPECLRNIKRGWQYIEL